MNAKEYLQQAVTLNLLIKSNIRQLERMRLTACSLPSADPSNERVATSQGSDRIGEITARIVDLENAIQDDIARSVILQSEIRERVNRLDNPEQRIVIINRYINFMGWDEISEDMCYSRQWLHILHKRALKNFETLFMAHVTTI